MPAVLTVHPVSSCPLGTSCTAGAVNGNIAYSQVKQPHIHMVHQLAVGFLLASSASSLSIENAQKISSEISLASASTVRSHFGCIFKATTEYAT